MHVLSRDQFIEGLGNDEFRLRVRPAKPSSLDDAIKAALELEAIQTAEASRRTAIATKTAEVETRQGHVVVPTSPVEVVHDALCSTMKEMVNALRGMSSDGPTRGGHKARYRGSGRRRPIDCWHCGEVGHSQARCPYLTVAGWNKPRSHYPEQSHARVQVGLGVMEEARWCT